MKRLDTAQSAISARARAELVADGTMSIKETAAFTGLSEWTIRQLLKDGVLQ